MSTNFVCFEPDAYSYQYLVSVVLAIYLADSDGTMVIQFNCIENNPKFPLERFGGGCPYNIAQSSSSAIVTAGVYTECAICHPATRTAVEGENRFP